MPRRNDIAKLLIIGSGPIVLILVLTASAAWACTVFGLRVKAAPNFDLLVQDNGRPVAGIPIVVTRIGDKTGKRILELRSGPDGKVAIRGLLPGEYAIDNLGPIKSGGLIAMVKRNGPTTLANPVIFNWPWQEIVKFKSLQGTLRAASLQHPFKEVDVAVLTVDTGVQIKTLHTGPDGHFKFSDIPPGLYVVRIHGNQPGVGKNWQVDGPIAVEIAPGSPSAPDDVEFMLGESSCGIWYTHCPRRDSINLASRRIQVTDALGAVVGLAQYTVEDRSANKVAIGESNRDGVIELPAELRGAYKLTIARIGFTPLEQPLELVAPEAGAKDLSVLLNIGGDCSQAKLEAHATPQ